MCPVLSMWNDLWYWLSLFTYLSGGSGVHLTSGRECLFTECSRQLRHGQPTVYSALEVEAWLGK